MMDIVSQPARNLRGLNTGFCAMLPLRLYSEIDDTNFSTITFDQLKIRVWSDLCPDMLVFGCLHSRNRYSWEVHLMKVLGTSRLHLQDIEDLEVYAEVSSREFASPDSFRVGDNIFGVIKHVNIEEEKVVLTLTKALPRIYKGIKLPPNDDRLQHDLT
eukprot:TRINITY_DN6583_c0_g1_i4.p1 TRINITY_DN6583_c0_g1~~TRINITY_DN6583_c0_g1_i4.p1  ORF type:complete len:158 (-),score=15.38 TRINITY_DN6583_c0_g1_i4:309-782(-)